MHRHNCRQECYAKLQLAKKIKEESMVEAYPNPNQIQGQAELQVVYSNVAQLVAAPKQQDAQQGQYHPVAPLQQPEQARGRRHLLKWEEKEMWIQLYRHIARNVKRGQYQLQPIKNGQCAKCRRIILAKLDMFLDHQENCRPEMYELGCPCGFLCSTLQSLGSHRVHCSLSAEIRSKGKQGWLQYISPAWRESHLFSGIRINDGASNAQPAAS